jgi:hypothetical protein
VDGSQFAPVRRGCGVTSRPTGSPRSAQDPATAVVLQHVRAGIAVAGRAATLTLESVERSRTAQPWTGTPRGRRLAGMLNGAVRRWPAGCASAATAQTSSPCRASRGGPVRGVARGAGPSSTALPRAVRGPNECEGIAVGPAEVAPAAGPSDGYQLLSSRTRSKIRRLWSGVEISTKILVRTASRARLMRQALALGRRRLCRPLEGPQPACHLVFRRSVLRPAGDVQPPRRLGQDAPELLAGPLLFAVQRVEHRDSFCRYGDQPLAHSQLLLDLRRVRRGVRRGLDTALDRDAPSLLELLAQRAAVGGRAKRGEGQSGLRRWPRPRAGWRPGPCSPRATRCP